MSGCWVDIWWLRLWTTDGRAFRWRMRRTWREELPLKFHIYTQDGFTVDRVEYLDGADEVLGTWRDEKRTWEVPPDATYSFTLANIDCSCCPEKVGM